MSLLQRINPYRTMYTINEKQLDKLIRLAKDLSYIVYKYQKYMKPREADKSRQMNKLIKQILQIKK